MLLHGSQVWSLFLISEMCQNEQKRKLIHVANRSLQVANLVKLAPVSQVVAQTGATFELDSSN